MAPPPDQLRKAQIAPTVPAQAKGKAQGPSREPQGGRGENRPPVYHRGRDRRLPALGWDLRPTDGIRGVAALVCGWKQDGGPAGLLLRRVCHHHTHHASAIRIGRDGQLHPHRHTQPEEHQQPQVVARCPADAVSQQPEHSHQDHPQHRAQETQPQQGEEKAGHVSSPLFSSHRRSKRSRSSATSSRSSCRRSTRAATRSLALPA